ncbi:hypothetical protein BDW74DRAFT_179092 [Aspergillus multicolor]|uniref:uncharacterized protein n=1 Tax=Aspergillus multicolor TaxID=41759 RepID=UPI003CCD1E75
MSLKANIPHEVRLSTRVEGLIRELKTHYTNTTSTNMTNLCWSIEHLMTVAMSMMAPGSANVATIFQHENVRKDFARFSHWLEALHIIYPDKWANYNPLPYHLRPLSMVASADITRLSTTQDAAEALVLLGQVRPLLSHAQLNTQAAAEALVLLNTIRPNPVPGPGPCSSQVFPSANAASRPSRFNREMFKVMDALIILARGTEENSGEAYMVKTCSSELAPALRQANAVIEVLWQEAERAGLRELVVQDSTDSFESDSSSDSEAGGEGAEMQVDEDGDTLEDTVENTNNNTIEDTEVADTVHDTIADADDTEGEVEAENTHEQANGNKMQLDSDSASDTSDYHQNDFAVAIVHENASRQGRRRARRPVDELRAELRAHLTIYLPGRRHIDTLRAVPEERFHAVVQAHFTRVHDAVKPIVHFELVNLLHFILQERGIAYLEGLIPTAEGDINYMREGGRVDMARVWTNQLRISPYVQRARWANVTFCVLRCHFMALGIWRY